MNLRIAMISDHASPIARPGSVDSGGQNVYVAQLAENLARQGHTVDVYTRRDAKLSETVVCRKGVRVIHVPAGPARFVPKEELLPYMETFGDFMLRRMEKEPAYDLVHANFFMSGLVGCRLKEDLDLPLVVTFHALGRVRQLHQGQADKFPPERIEIEHEIFRKADRIVAECPQDEDDQIQLYQAASERIRIVPCGFDERELCAVPRAQARDMLGFSWDEPLIAQVGRMVPRKGVDNAIRGFARLIHRHKISARMVIVGGESKEPDPVRTPEIGRLQEIAREEGVIDRVIFAGQASREALKYYYSAADVFVTTPWYEPFGITPLEAMACGTPVVGADVGGIKFTVVDGKTGFLVPPRDPDALGERLAVLCRDHGMRERFGQMAQLRVRKIFTWQKVARMTSDVYGDLMRELGRVQPASEMGSLAAPPTSSQVLGGR